MAKMAIASLLCIAVRQNQFSGHATSRSVNRVPKEPEIFSSKMRILRSPHSECWRAYIARSKHIVVEGGETRF
jgi:hypothetical protein